MLYVGSTEERKCKLWDLLIITYLENRPHDMILLPPSMLHKAHIIEFMQRPYEARLTLQLPPRLFLLVHTYYMLQIPDGKQLSIRWERGDN